jgi:excisionase family DNA binding protein
MITITVEALAVDPMLAAQLLPAERTRLLRVTAIASRALELADLMVEPTCSAAEPHRPRMLYVPEIAERTGRPESTIRELFRAGQLPGRKIGKLWTMTEDAFAAWLDSGQSVTLPLPHDDAARRAAASATTPQSARPYAVEVRRVGGRARDHGQEVGGRDAGHAALN